MALSLANLERCGSRGVFEDDDGVIGILTPWSEMADASMLTDMLLLLLLLGVDAGAVEYKVDKIDKITCSRVNQSLVA